MANERVRQIYQFIAVSGEGKKQSAFNVFQPNGDIDTREKCEVTATDNVNRRDEFDCDGVDLVREAILTRDSVLTLNYNEGFTPQQAARWLAYQQGVAASPTGSTVNEVQSLTYNGVVTGGTFTLSLTHEGKTGLTEPIAFDATAAVIKAALIKKMGTATAMGKLIKTGDVTVAGTFGTSVTITFTGRFAATNVALFTVDNTAITGGGTIDAAQDTAGSQKSHAITRTTDGSLPLFSVIVGDKNDAYDDFKYGDCVVSDISFGLQQAGGALATMSVTILANYVAEREAAYSAPACVNITPLKVEDCKLSIDSVFHTGDTSSLTAFLNNNVPRDAAFGYDDIDITTAYQRGDQPTQGFTASVFGSPDTALYQLAEAEETDGNEVAFILYLGNTGNRVTLTGPTTKIKFQPTRLGFAGALRQSTINFDATPHGSPPLTYSASISQANAFLVASV